MSREILFRGKRILDGKWIEGFFSQKKEKCYICTNPYQLMDGYSSKNGQHYGFGDFYEVDPKTVCQYTGLTDKNKSKIFEGDIVKAVEDFEEIYVVEWDEDIARYVLTQNGSTMTDFGDCYSPYMEVMGNILDNPELLDGDTE